MLLYPSRLWFIAAVALAAAGALRAETLTSIQQRLGAEVFYDNGIDGSGVIIGNIEALHPRVTHETIDQSFQHSFQFTGLPNPGAGGATSESHATSVSGAMVASDKFNDDTPTGLGHGIAPGATLWTGRIATTVSGLGFSDSVESVGWPLMIMGDIGVTTTGPGATDYTIGGPEARRVDVINSSWGFTNDTALTVENLFYDHVTEQGVTVVASAGNTGPGISTVGAPSNSFNVISVGATSGTGLTEAVTAYSSRGPEGAFDENFTYLQARTKPDIVAPGGSGLFGGGIDLPAGGSDTATTNVSGTSFAAPLVAGAAALLIDEGRTNGRSVDPRVMKAVLLNSADKLAGWSQGLFETDGVLVTVTPLDNAQGAGRLDFAGAYEQYTSASGDGTGLGLVGNIGWDLNTVSLASNDNAYIIDAPLEAGSIFDITLTWHMHRGVSGFDPFGPDPFGSAIAFYDNYDDLDLYVFKVDEFNQVIGDAVAISGSRFDNVEHLHLTVPETARYMVVVNFFGEIFDLTDTDGDSEVYAIAWSSVVAAVPEPTTFAIVAAMSVALLRRRRRAA